MGVDMAEAKTYRAIATGYDGKAIIPEGKVFTTDIPKGKWMQELDAEGNPVPEKEDKPKRGRPAKTED